MYFIIGIIIAAGLAFLPASIAQRKGKDFLTWYVYGFLLWIVAIFHAISLPEPHSSEKNENATFTSVKELSLPEKVDLNCPITIMGYDILKGDNGTSCIRIIFRNLDKGIITAIKLSVIGCNSFGDVVKVDGQNEFTILVQDLHIDKCTEFKNQDYIVLPDENIRTVFLTVSQIQFLDGSIYNNTPNCIEVTFNRFESPEDEETARTINPKAICYPEENAEYWTCSCGQVNTNDTSLCLFCGSEKVKGLYGCLKEKLLQLQHEKAIEDEEKALQQNLQKKKELKKFIIVGLVLAIICATVLSSISYIHAKEADQILQSLYGTKWTRTMYISGSQMEIVEWDLLIDETQSKITCYNNNKLDSELDCTIKVKIDLVGIAKVYETHYSSNKKQILIYTIQVDDTGKVARLCYSKDGEFDFLPAS